VKQNHGVNGSFLAALPCGRTTGSASVRQKNGFINARHARQCFVENLKKQSHFFAIKNAASDIEKQDFASAARPLLIVE